MGEVQPPDDNASDIGDASHRVRKIFRGIVDVAPTSPTLNLAASERFTMTLDRDVTIAFSNITTGDEFEVMFTQNGTGGWVVTWPSSTPNVKGGAPFDGDELLANAVILQKFKAASTSVIIGYPAQVVV